MSTFFIDGASSGDEDQLNEWREAIGCPCPNHNSVERACRKRVLENFEKEPRLRLDIRNAFVNCLVKEFNSNCQDALNAITRAQSNSVSLMLEGPKIISIR